MPELPEVETVVRQLRPKLVGRTVGGIVLHTPGLVRCEAVPAGRLAGSTISDVRRRGKFIRLDLAQRSSRAAPCRITVLVHLRMTGRLTVHREVPPRDRHDHIDLVLDGRRVLRFRDMRKFGGWWLLPTSTAEALPPLSALGAEPLEISREEFRGLLADRRRQIKALLLDQRLLAGVGNIYADESLFAARIHPATTASRISAERVDALWRHLRRILRQAIRRQGSTISTFTRPDGRAGRYQDRFRVYGHAGQPCERCGGTLKRAIVAGRGTTFCPRCQRRVGTRRLKSGGSLA